MFYKFTDIRFLGHIVRLIRADDGDDVISKGLSDIAKLTRQENENMFVYIIGRNGTGDSYNGYQSQHERDLWKSFIEKYTLSHDDYTWTRAWAVL